MTDVDRRRRRPSAQSLLRWAAGIGEQGIVALTTLASFALLSRLATLPEVGAVATALAIWLLMEALQRPIVILPFIATCPRPEADPAGFGSFIALNSAFSVGTAGVLLLAGPLISAVAPELGRATTLAAPLAGAGSLFLFTRQMLYHLQLHHLAAINAVGVAVITLAGLSILAAGGQIDAGEAVGVLSLGYLLPSLVTTFWLGRRARYSLEGVRRLLVHRALVGDFMTASLALHIASNGAPLVLSVTAGPSAVAIFMLARTLMRPFTLVIHAVSDMARARFSRQLDEQDPTALAAGVRSTQLALLALCAAPLLVVLIWTGPILGIAYGQAGAAATDAARLWVLALVPYLLYAPMDAALTALREGRVLARVNLAGMGAMLAVMAVALAAGAFTPSTAVLSIAAAHAVVLVLAYRRYRTGLPAA